LSRDAALIGEVVGTAILIVEANCTRRQSARRAKDSLEASGVRLLARFSAIDRSQFQKVSTRDFSIAIHSTGSPALRSRPAPRNEGRISNSFRMERDRMTFSATRVNHNRTAKRCHSECLSGSRCSQEDEFR
jgi:hypothetical protein